MTLITRLHPAEPADFTRLRLVEAAQRATMLSDASSHAEALAAALRGFGFAGAGATVLTRTDRKGQRSTTAIVYVDRDGITVSHDGSIGTARTVTHTRAGNDSAARFDPESLRGPARAQWRKALAVYLEELSDRDAKHTADRCALIAREAAELGI